MTDNPRRPTSRRRWSASIVLLCVAALLVVLAWRINARLQPITVRAMSSRYWFRYSLHGQGYPAIQEERLYAGSHANTPPIFMLDDRGHPMPGIPSNPHVSYQASPLRRFFFTWGYDPTGRRITEGRLYTQAGACTRIPVGALRSTHMLAVTDTGLLQDQYGHITGPQGTPVPRTIPAPPGRLALHIPGSAGLVADPRLLPAYKGGKELHLYDPVRKVVVRSFRWTPTPKYPVPAYNVTAVFPRGSRTAIVRHQHVVDIFQGAVRIGSYAAPGTLHYGEDGSLWWQGARAITVLQWRAGAPRLAAGPVPPLDPGFPAWESPVALWGDGRYRATAQTIETGRFPLRDQLAPLASRLHLPFPSVRKTRRLTLRKDGWVVGTYAVPLHPIDPGRPFPWDPPYREHLAFTRDGRYLAWSIDTQSGWHDGVKLIVFDVRAGAH